MRGVRVATERRANTAQFVRRYRRADTTTADQDPDLSRAALHGLADLFRVVRIIVRDRAVVSAEVSDLVARMSQFIYHSFIERVSTMICANRYPHHCLTCLSALSVSIRVIRGPITPAHASARSQH